MTEIRDDAVDPAVIEAAAARVWANLAAQCQAPPAAHLRRFPGADPRVQGRPSAGSPRPAGERSPARVRRLPPGLRRPRGFHAGARRPAPRQLHRPLGRGRHRDRRRRTLRLVRRTISTATTPDAPSCRPSTARSTKFCPPESRCWPCGQDLPDGIEIRTAKDSDAMLQLKDGSIVELRERSGFSNTQTASDLTIRLGRGSIIVQAAKRSSGHLYVATADCRVAVTGTVFSVTTGVKGSRVSVIRRRSPRLAGQQGEGAAPRRSDA